MIHTKEEKPLAVSYGYLENQDLCFITKDGIVRFQPNYPQNAIINILKHCTGLNSICSIQELSGLSPKQFNGIIAELYSREIIFPSHKLGIWFHERSLENSKYRVSFNLEEINALKGLKVKKCEKSEKGLTILEKILVRRRSIREFSGLKISKKELFDFLKDLYFRNGVPTVASGGGLYPLQFYVISLHTEFPIGLYKYEPNSSKLKLIKKIDDISEVFFCLQDQSIVEDASFLTIICADLNIHMQKYSNCGYAYTLMEVGSVIQNAYLKAAETSRGVLAYGGFNDSKLKEFLNLQQDTFPLVVLMFGGISKKIYSQKRLSSHIPFYFVQTLIDTFSKEKGIIKKYAVSTLAYKDEEISKYCASATYESPKMTTGRQRSGNGFGAGFSKNEALTKAIAEASERYYSGELFFDKKDSFNNLKNAILPEDFWKYTPDAIQNGKLGIFNRDAIYSWVKGHYIKNGKDVSILADQIFYPLDKYILGYQPVYKTSSSGVAAHMSEDRASECALLELIERDAVALAWYGQHQIHKIGTVSLPSDLQEKHQFWKKRGFLVDFYDITTDSIPVILCVFTNRSEYPFFVVGGGADYSFEKALEKSIEEAQYAMLAWRAGDHRNRIEEKDIRTPLDHGLYYAQAKQANIPFKLLNISSIPINKIKKHREYSYKDLVKKFDPIEIVLFKSPQLSVVRVMSTNLLPLNFGYKMEAINYKRLKRFHLKEHMNNEPHFFP